MNDKKKLKRKLALSFVMLLLLAVMLAFSGITLAWFYKGNDQIPADTLSGSIHAAYFNGGNGTVPSANATYKTEGSTYPSYEYGGTNGPYQIDNATQLYNFAWLQYLGYFDDTTYFVLTDNINASSIVLPPVGTSDNPFVGYFDGNGYTISGLRVSNDKTELNNTDVDGNKFNIPHQALENEELTDSAEIVGFFGVVGEIDEDYTSTSFVPTVKNLTLSGATIETQTSNSLAGIAAGYVNGVMEGVVVSGTSTITNAENNVTPLSYTGNLSDYALVGFCEEPYRKVLKAETVDVYEPDVELGSLGRLGDAGSGNAWGNSIDMKSIYQDLLGRYTAVENDNSALARTATAKSITIDRTGAAEVRTEETTWSGSAVTQNGYNIVNYKDDYSSYSFAKRTDTHDFLYLYGDNNSGSSTTLDIRTNYIDKAYYIYSGNNYLSFNGTSFSNITTKADATKWIIDNSGYIYTIIQNGNTYNRYYLVNDSGTLTYQQVAAISPLPQNVNTWTVTDTSNENSISNNNCYLTFDSGWKLLRQELMYITDVDETDHSIHPHYLTVSNGSLQNTNSENSSIVWIKTYTDNTQTQFTLSCNVGNTTYYLMENEGALQLQTAPNTPTVWKFKGEASITGDENYPKIYTLADGDDGYALYYNEDDAEWELTPFKEQASGTGIGNEWGASIPMKDMYDNLYFIKTNNLASRTYDASKTRVIDERTGEITEKDHVSGTLADGDYGATTKHLRFVLENFGEITFTDRNTTNNNYDSYMYLTDVQNTATNSTALKIIRILDQDITANYIKNGSNYLTLNGSSNGITNSTTEANATKWIIDNNGYIYVEVEGATSVELRYVSVSNGTLTVTASQNTAWTFDETNSRLYCNVNGQTYYLVYDNNWNLVLSDVVYTLKDKDNKYLNINNGVITRESTPSTYWSLNNNKYNTVVGGTVYEINAGQATLNNAMLVQDGNGNYLGISGDALDNTDYSGAVDWYFSGNPSALFTIQNGTKKYLNINNGTLQLSNSSNIQWNIGANTISNGNYQLYCDGNEWYLIDTSFNVLISDSNGNYLNINNNQTGVTNGTDAIQATRWKFSGNNSGMLSTFYKGSTYYLNQSNNSTLTISTGSGQSWSNNNGLYYNTRIFIWSTDHYIYLDNSEWKLQDDSGTSLTFDTSSISVATQKGSIQISPLVADITYVNQIDLIATTTRPFTITMSSDKIGETYFPLQVDVDTLKSDKTRFSTNDKNTGYVISGYTDSGGDIRVSKYARTNIEKSLTNNQLDNAKVRTIMGGTDQLISSYGLNNFVKYTASSETMNNTISTDSNIYGLHFMNATIGINSLVTAPSVMINGKTYTDYQMPKDSINFSLKEKGYINFFAGTYYTNNDSFFSLHKIERYQDGDTFPSGKKVNDIKSIKEIIEIYGNGSKRDPYIYKLSDGTNTTYESWTYYPSGKLKQHDTYNSVPSGYSKVFETAWTKKQTSGLTTNAVYYFEIPADAGEYALGSVSGGTGAYLMYLDIGTGGSEKAPEGNSELLLNGYTVFSAYNELSNITYYEVSTETQNERFNSYPTYFPLAWDNGAVSSSNTGYIISGAYTNSNPPGDIRVSKYEKSYSSNWRGIGNSLTNGKLTDNKIYTYKFGNDGGWQTISQYGTDNLYKYLNSKAQLQDTIGSAATGDVYGLHFMDAPLGTSNLITVPNATINGHTYTDYEMPRDSIDFNLKTPGYINVFAGTYFSGSQNGVNCFFSLHKIERDANQQITSIREIKAIYEDNGTYNYQYADGAEPSGTKVFDTDCLTQPSGLRSDTVYYFEIPAGAGEFAIGSVDGKYGGYLLYLDISTHQGDSVVKREKMVINTVEYELPKGVIFDGADRTVFEVPITMTGDIEFTVNNGAVTATSPLTASSASSSKTIEKVTVSDQAGEFSIKRTTENGTVIYEYSERALTENDTIEELAAYFNSSVNNVIFTYNYLLEENNSVNNVLEDIEYSTDGGFAITRYQITARAIVEAVTATVQAIGSDASYIEFNEVANIQTSQTIIIPTQNNNS